MYQSIYVIAEELNECVIATEVRTPLLNTTRRIMFLVKLILLLMPEMNHLDNTTVP